MTPTAIETFLSSVTTLVTSLISWGTDVLGLITGNAILTAFVGLTLFGGAIGLVKVFLHR
jgi:hypothetical protein